MDTSRYKKLAKIVYSILDEGFFSDTDLPTIRGSFEEGLREVLMVSMDAGSDANTLNTLLTQYKQTGSAESIEGVFEHMFKALDSDKTVLIMEFFYVSFIELVNSKLSPELKEKLQKLTELTGISKEEIEKVRTEYTVL